IVISAMGKTTNALELIVDALCQRQKSTFDELIAERRQYHQNIMRELFDDPNHLVFNEIDAQFDALTKMYDARIPDNYDFEYDQIVSLGEVISTRIVNAYLNQRGISSGWVDARELIRTNNNYREGEVDWNKTEELFKQHFIPRFNDVDVQVTQGFIGHTSEGLTTTLGREGSDYTAGI